MSKLGRSLINALREANGLYSDSSYLANKPWPKRLWWAFYLSPLYEPIQKIETFYNVNKERIQRLYAYGKYLWAYGEFDSSYSLGLLELNLKRLNHILRHGNSVFTKHKQKRMAIAIECLKRMQDPYTYYTEPACTALFAKWGFVEKWDIIDHPTNKSIFYTTRDKFRNSLKPSKKRMFDKEYKEVLEYEDKMFKRDMALFCKIFAADVRSWWD